MYYVSNTVGDQEELICDQNIWDHQAYEAAQVIRGAVMDERKKSNYKWRGDGMENPAMQAAWHVKLAEGSRILVFVTTDDSGYTVTWMVYES